MSSGPWHEIDVESATESDLENITVSEIVRGSPSYSSLIFDYNGIRSAPVRVLNISVQDVRTRVTF